MDPWLCCQSDVTIPEIPLTKFEDNFTPTEINKLPDSEEYIAILEEKLRKIKNNPRLLEQLAAKREACMQELLLNTAPIDEVILNLEEPIENSQILKVIAPQKQALNQGELVDLVNYDQLKNEESDSEVSKDSTEGSDSTQT